MPVVSQTPTTAHVEVGGRGIYIVSDEKTQSVNVCTPANREGQYEQVFYFCGDYRVRPEDLAGWADLDGTTKSLRRRLGDQVRDFSPDGRSNP